MLERLIIAGSGGQGVILIGKLLASSAVRHFSHVTFFPDYGAEVRGGASNCQVILSSGEISSPLAEEFDSMLIMDQASADRYLRRRPRACMTVVNSSMCSTVAGSASSVPVSEMANQLGNVCVANFLMLGAYLARKPVVDPEDIEEMTHRALSGRNQALIDLNIKAFRLGLAQ